MKRFLGVIVLLLLLAAAAFAGVKLIGKYDVLGIGPNGPELLSATFNPDGTATIGGTGYTFVPVDEEHPTQGVYCETGTVQPDRWDFSGGASATFTDWPPYPQSGPPATYQYAYSLDERQE